MHVVNFQRNAPGATFQHSSLACIHVPSFPPFTTFFVITEGIWAFLAYFTAWQCFKGRWWLCLLWPVALFCLISPNSADSGGSTASMHLPTVRFKLSVFSTLKAMFNNHWVDKQVLNQQTQSHSLLNVLHKATRYFFNPECEWLFISAPDWWPAQTGSSFPINPDKQTL